MLAAERIIQQCPAINKYFREEIPKNHKNVLQISKYNIMKYLNDQTLKGKLYFVIESATMFTRYNRFYRKMSQ
jgi:hypothetical protein